MRRRSAHSHHHRQRLLLTYSWLKPAARRPMCLSRNAVDQAVAGLSTRSMVIQQPARAAQLWIAGRLSTAARFFCERRHKFCKARSVGTYDRPFRGSQAIALSELTAHQLRCDFTRVYRDVYVRKRNDLTAHARAHAAAVYSGENSILAGRSAAALHGTKWIDAHEPAEVIRHDNFHAPEGLIVRQYSVHPDEIVSIHGRRVTTPARTAFDIGRTVQLPRAIEIVDALCNATQLHPHEVAELAERHPGARGIVGLRSMLALVDGGAESPPETRTRLAIIDAGLPRPETTGHRRRLRLFRCPRRSRLAAVEGARRIRGRRTLVRSSAEAARPETGRTGLANRSRGVRSAEQAGRTDSPHQRQIA